LLLQTAKLPIKKT